MTATERADVPGYEQGSTFSYLSTSSMTVVTWTRDDKGVWTCDDGREFVASDADVAVARAKEDGR